MREDIKDLITLASACGHICRELRFTADGGPTLVAVNWRKRWHDTHGVNPKLIAYCATHRVGFMSVQGKFSDG